MASRVDAGGARVYLQSAIVVAVAQLVRAPDCGSGGRGFKSHHSPKKKQVNWLAFFIYSCYITCMCDLNQFIVVFQQYFFDFGLIFTYITNG